MRKWVCAGIFGLILSCSVYVSATETTADEKFSDGLRQEYAPVLSEKPVIDGKIDDNAWKSAEPVDMFILNTPIFALAAKQTKVLLGRDNENLYIAFECLDPDTAKIKKDKAFNEASMEDTLFQNDCIELLLMPDPNVALWYHMAIDADGQYWARTERPLKPEEKISGGDLVEFKPFSGKIQYGVAIGKDSWTVEIAIPFQDLGIKTEDLAKQTWRINLCREEKALAENSSWNRTVAFKSPDRFGKLVFSPDAGTQNEKVIFRTSAENCLAAKKLEKEAKIAAKKERKYNLKYAYSFGSSEAPLKQGYERVTPSSAYSAEDGYGWEENVSGLQARYKKWDGSADCKNMYNEELTASYIEGNASADPEKIEHSFRVDLPNGEYKVHMVMGDPAEVNVLKRRLFEVFANDQLIFPVEVSRLIFAQPFFHVKVTDGSLRLKFVGKKKIQLNLSPEVLDISDDEMKTYVPGWVANSVVVYPAAERKAAESQIGLDEQDFNRLPADKMAREFVPPADPVLTDVSSQEKERGYILFTRDVSLPIRPSSAPKRSEIPDTVNVLAAPGETAAVSMGVYPLRDVDKFEISAGDLKGSGGVLKASSLEFGLLRIIPIGTIEKYQMMPMFVEPLQYVDTDLNEKETRQIWITVKVPKGLNPGIYTGSISSRVAGGKENTLALQVEVLPFDLPESKKRFGVYFLPASWGSTAVHASQDLAGMRDYGLNSMVFLAGWVRQFDKMKSGLLLAKRFGFTGPVVLYYCMDQTERTSLAEKERTELKKMLSELRDYSKQNNLPEPIFTSWDELTKAWMRELANDTFKTAKAVGGIRTYATCTPSTIQSVSQYVDISCMIDAPDFRKFRVSDEDRKKGKELWTYSNDLVSINVNWGATRFIYGWFMWSAGIDGNAPWEYQCFEKNPYNWLNGFQYMFCAPRSVGGYMPVPTMNYEMMRIGINDSRYIQLLSDLIRKGKQSSDPKVVAIAQEEEAKLDKIADSVQGSPSYYDSHGYWKEEIYAKLRTRVVEGIIKLQKAGVKMPE